MLYDPDALAQYYDDAGFAEYARHDSSPEMRIKLELHMRCLRSFVSPGSEVLEIGPGPGRFTEVLAEMGCRVSVVDISSEQLNLNRERAVERGYAGSVITWLKADICDLTPLADGLFDSIVAFGGPFSYVLDQRDLAMRECLNHLSARGRLLLSVMSRWGTLHAFLRQVHALPREELEVLVETGDVTPRTTPEAAADGHWFHMFTADELTRLLEENSLSVEFISASNALSTKWGELLEDEGGFSQILGLEELAAQASGALDMGTHIIAVASRLDGADV
jgi:SAM-dependent methyltransferase